MSGQMTERAKAIIVNIAIVVGLVWCNFEGYPPKIIVGCGVFLLVFANVLMYLKRRDQ
jgi:hypothetical protein